MISKKPFSLMLPGALLLWLGVWGTLAPSGLAHVTPMMKLSSVQETLAHFLPDGDRFVKEVHLTEAQKEKLKALGNWDQVGDSYKFFVAHGDNYNLDRAVIFMPAYSRHGAIVVAVALDGRGRVIDAQVTAAQTEIMQWVEPLLKKHYLNQFQGQDSSMAIELNGDLKENTSEITQTYARILGNAVKRSAQLFDVVFKS